jgi:hypothetical protein
MCSKLCNNHSSINTCPFDVCVIFHIFSLTIQVFQWHEKRPLTSIIFSFHNYVMYVLQFFMNIMTFHKEGDYFPKHYVFMSYTVAPLLWPSVGVKPNTWKSWELESFETPECSEIDNKGQNTWHWGVLGVIEKVLKRRYRKWPRIGNSDICSPSYGQKTGRESNWQFDSRPLKVRNRPLPDVQFGSATWRWKDLDKDYNFGLDLVAIQL